MPKSDTWPGGITMETMAGMDSAGSCDSVVSMNSSYSEESLDHLSAEEKACLMFLEETIESLNTEEDSGLSNDESELLPAPGNVANTAAHLSASMGQNNVSNVSKNTYEPPTGEAGQAPKPAYGCLVPTPLAVANSSAIPLPRSRVGLVPDKENFHPGSKPSSSDAKPRQRVPSEVNVVVIPPPTKLREAPGGWGPEPPRGPLSYEALVQLRKSASMKRAPDSPAENRDWSKQPSVLSAPSEAQPRGPPDTPLQNSAPQEPSRYNPSPPVVAPKPRRIPSSESSMTQNKAASSPTSDSLPSDPHKVRNEALLKLGLLRDSRPEPSAPMFPFKSHSSLDLSAHGLLKDPSLSNPGRGLPFSYTQGARETVSNPRPLKSSSCLLLQRSLSEQAGTPLSHALRPSGVKAATLERSGVGLGSQAKQQGTTLSSQGNDGCGPPAASRKAPESTPPVAKPAPQKPAQPVGFSVVMVPNMGVDRKEALRKLGLLKD